MLVSTGLGCRLSARLSICQLGAEYLGNADGSDSHCVLLTALYMEAAGEEADNSRCGCDDVQSRSRFDLGGCCRGHRVEDRHLRLGCGEDVSLHVGYLARGGQQLYTEPTPCSKGSEDASDATVVADMLVVGSPQYVAGTSAGETSNARAMQGVRTCGQADCGNLRRRWRDSVMPRVRAIWAVNAYHSRCEVLRGECRAKSQIRNLRSATGWGRSTSTVAILSLLETRFAVSQRVRNDGFRCSWASATPSVCAPEGGDVSASSQSSSRPGPGRCPGCCPSQIDLDPRAAIS